MSVKYTDLTRHIKKLEKKLTKRAYQEFMTKTTNTVAAELEKLVIEATPFQSGHLRGSWTTEPARVTGNICQAELKNDVEYAPYVEYGHRQTHAWGHKMKHPRWVEGQFFMTDVVEQFRPVMPLMVGRMVDEFWEGLDG